MSRYKGYGNYDLEPKVVLSGDFTVYNGWPEIWKRLWNALQGESFAKTEPTSRLLFLDCYQGVLEDNVLASLQSYAPEIAALHTKQAFYDAAYICQLVEPDLGDDAVFGYITRLQIQDYFCPERIVQLKKQLQELRYSKQRAVLLGAGAACFAESKDTVIHLSVPRWEIQQRQHQGLLGNLGVEDMGESLGASPQKQYKHSYFVDWRVLDRHKQGMYQRWDWVIDCSARAPLATEQEPKMIDAASFFVGLQQAAQQPVRLVPFFCPGVWGGQWLREVCGLQNYRRNTAHREEPVNYAWGFDCVPEENSLQIQYGQTILEFPAMDLVFCQAESVLGGPVYARFGREFPIRFDFLDTMGGQNLSFQVHPKTEYIQEQFGMRYTQDESYYILDTETATHVYLGLQEDVRPAAMIEDLRQAQANAGKPFPAEKYVNTLPTRKHDHFLIPAGTPHCSGAGSVVLEISATPYIFTFKLWDWDRLDLDGKPRPIHLEHGIKNIDWRRKSKWVEKNLANCFEELSGADLCEAKRAERTGLHALEFIETRRYWFDCPTQHDTGGAERGSVHVLNLVEGEAARVKSPYDAFEPFEVHYAETFIIPAAVGGYILEPAHELHSRQQLAVLKAYVRTGL